MGGDIGVTSLRTIWQCLPKFQKCILLESALLPLGTLPKYWWVNGKNVHFSILGKNKIPETTEGVPISRGQDKCILPHHSLEFPAACKVNEVELHVGEVSRYSINLRNKMQCPSHICPVQLKIFSGKSHSKLLVVDTVEKKYSTWKTDEKRIFRFKC